MRLSVQHLEYQTATRVYLQHITSLQNFVNSIGPNIDPEVDFMDSRATQSGPEHGHSPPWSDPEGPSGNQASEHMPPEGSEPATGVRPENQFVSGPDALRQRKEALVARLRGAYIQQQRFASTRDRSSEPVSEVMRDSANMPTCCTG